MIGSVVWKHLHLPTTGWKYLEDCQVKMVCGDMELKSYFCSPSWKTQADGKKTTLVSDYPTDSI